MLPDSVTSDTGMTAYFVGTVAPNGTMYIANGIGGSRYVTINLNTLTSATGVLTNAGSSYTPDSLADWTYANGLLYGAETDGDIVVFDPATGARVARYAGVLPSLVSGNFYGAAYTLGNGTMVFSNNNTGQLWLWDPANPTVRINYGTGPSNSNNDGTCVPSSPSIHLEKTTTASNLVVGQSITYTFVGTNTGNVPLNNITITDIAAQFTGSGTMGTIGGCTWQGGVAGTLYPGRTVTCSASYTVTQGDVDRGSVYNNAEIKGISADLNATVVTDQDDATVSGTQTPSIDLVKTASPNSLAVGTPISYTFIATNTGNVTLHGVTITETQFSGSGTVPVPGGCTTSMVGTTDPATLAPGETMTCTATYSPTQADVDAYANNPVSGQLTNTAHVVGLSPANVSVTDDANAAVPANPSPQITLTKTPTPTTYESSGDVITYQFVATNTGNVTLTDVSILDDVTAFTGDGGALTAIAGCTTSNAASTNPTTLLPGETMTCAATYTVSQEDLDDGTVHNKADVTGTPPSGPAASATATADAAAIQSPGLSVNKVASLADGDGDGLADVGEVITYSFTVTNTGNVTLAPVTVTDAKLGLTDAACVASLSVGATDVPCSTTVAYTVTQADVDAGVVHNSVTATGTPPSGPPVVSPPDTTDTPADQAGGLSLTKVADKSDLVVGEVITYTFTATNEGVTTLTDVAISEVAGSFTGSGVMSPIGGCTVNGVAATNGSATLLPGESLACTATYTVTQADVDAGQVTNVADADGTSPTGPVDAPDATEQVPGTASPGLSVNKVASLADGDGDGLADVGEVITYSFTVTNTGNVTLAPVTVTDAKLGLTDAACVASLSVGATDVPCSTTVAYTVTQADVDAGVVHNSVTATGTPPSGPPVVSPPDTTDTPADQAGGLSLTKVADKSDLVVGEVITYTFTATNEGVTTLTDVAISEVAGSFTGSGVMSPIGGCTVNGVAATNGSATLLPGESLACTATYTVTQADVDAGQVTNVADADGTSPTGPVDAPDATEQVPGTASPGLSVNKVASLADGDGDGLADVGEVITYSFTVTNTGNVTLAPVTVTDAKLGLTDAACVASLSVGATDVPCSTTVAYTVTQADVDAGVVHNSVTATGTPPSGPPVVSPPDTTDTPADQAGGLSLTKVADKSDLVVGEVITYTFTATNEGVTTLTDVAISEVAGSFTGSGVMSPIGGCTVNGVAATNGSATLLPGESLACTATYTVTQADVDAGQVTNVADADGTSPTGPVDAPDATEQVPGTASPGLSVNKVASLADGDGDGLADVGEVITYSFTVTNTGNVTLAPVTVTDAKLGLTDAACVASLSVGATDVPCSTTVAYTVTQADVDAGVVHNSVTATGTPPSGPPVVSPPDTTDTPADQAGGLSLTKVADKSDLVVGEVITYTFTATNEGVTTLTDVAISEVAGSFTGSGVMSPIGGCTVNGVAATNGSATLLPGESLACTATYTVTQADVDAGQVTNVADADGTSPTGPVDAPDATEQVPGTASPGLSVNKVASLADGDGDGLADVGEVITYSFTVTNTGNVTLAPVTVTDAKLGLTDAACVASLSVGATDVPCSTTVAYTVTQADVDAGVVHNSVTATGTPPSGPPVVSPPDTTDTPADQAGGLSLTKVADKSDLVVGEVITYTFTATNEGVTTLTDVAISEVAGSFTGSGVMSPIGGCTVNGVAATNGSATLLPGESLACTATYTVTQADVDAGQVTNVADADGTSPTGPVDAPDATEQVPGTASPGLSVNKVASLADGDGDGLADVGEVITYSFTVTNTGNVTLAPVTVTDAKLGLTDAACVASLSVGATDVPCSTTVAYTVTQADVDAGVVHNSVTATGTPPSGPPVVSPPDTTDTPADQAGGLSLTKVADKSDLVVGEVITYTFTATNEGVTTLTDVAISEVAGSFTGSGVMSPIGGCTVNGVAATNGSATLLPGESLACTATYTVTQADVDAGQVTNVADADGTSPTGPVDAPDATEQVPGTASPGLSVNKVASLADGDGDGLADVGEVITYSFTVTNTGNVTLAPVTVTDAKLGLTDAACVASLSVGATDVPCSTTVAYTVTQADVDAGVVHNSVTATGTPPSGPPVVSPPDTTDTPADQAGGLSLTKVADKSDLVVGEVITYTFTATNEGVTTLTDVAISEVAGSFTGSGVMSPIGGCTVNGVAATNGSATLLPGESLACTATYTVTQADVDAGQVTNVADADGTSPTGPVDAPDATEQVPGTASPGLSVNKVASLADGDGDGLADVGEVITYSFTVTNTGNVTLAPVTVTDAKLGLTDAACVASLSVGATDVPCSTTVAYTVTQADVDAGVVHNSVTATGTPPSGPPVVSPPDTTDTPADQAGGLSLTKVADKSDLVVGEVITYTFTATNEGVTTLTDVAISEVAGSFTGSGVMSPIGGCTVNGVAATNGSATLLPGESLACTATYTVTQADVDAGQVTNVADADGTSPTGPVDAPDATEQVPGTASPGLSVNKVASLADGDGDGLADVGEVITYSFTVTNTGNVTLAPVTVTDAKLGLTDAACVASLSVGATDVPCSTTVAYTVTQADVDAGVVHNSVTATGTPPSGPPVVSPPDTTDTPADQAGGLSLTKVADKSDLVVGEVITYTFTATNTGTTTLSPVTISDAKLGLLDSPCAASLAPGASVACSTSGSYLVTQADVDTGHVDNTATATGIDPSGSTATATDSVTVVGTALPSMSLDKTSRVVDVNGNGKTDVGDQIWYSFVIVNTGNITLSNVVVNDPMLGRLGIGITCATTTLAPRASTTCTADEAYVVTQTDVDAGGVFNRASATADVPPGVPPVVPPNDVTETPAVPAPAIDLDKKAKVEDVNGNGRTDIGDYIHYSFKVTNTGNTTLTNVRVDDEMLAGLGIGITCPQTTLSVGASMKCRADEPYVITRADAELGFVLNTAIVLVDPPADCGCKPPSDSDQENVPVTWSSPLLPDTGLSNAVVWAGAGGLGLLAAGSLMMVAGRRRRGE
ncbi:hypothetical protein GCM10023066_12060 [Nocardioides kongjuensis]